MADTTFRGVRSPCTDVFALLVSTPLYFRPPPPSPPGLCPVTPVSSYCHPTATAQSMLFQKPANHVHGAQLLQCMGRSAGRAVLGGCQRVSGQGRSILPHRHLYGCVCLACEHSVVHRNAMQVLHTDVCAILTLQTPCTAHRPCLVACHLLQGKAL